LRRAVARYQRNQSAAPAGYPADGLAALLHLGALAGAGELAGGPRTLRYAVGALDQLSRRMRATATADSAKHAQHASQRAHRRRQPTPRALALSFRANWPPWVATDEHENPIFDPLGMLALDPDARGGVPPVDSDQYRMIVRDAYLLAGRQLPADVDARKQMALRHQHKLQHAPRHASPSASSPSSRTAPANPSASWGACRPHTAKRGLRDCAARTHGGRGARSSRSKSRSPTSQPTWTDGRSTRRVARGPGQRRVRRAL
jgi:hypothetical protein